MNNKYPSIASFESFVQLRDFKAGTQRAYARAVRKCAGFFQCDPATLSEGELRDYFVYLRQQRHLGASAMKVVRYALQAFFQGHLKQGSDWSVFTDLRIKPDQTLPQVLAHDEVLAILAEVRELRFRTCLRLIYHTGLRISEAVCLQLQDLENSRTPIPRLRVRRGKGGRQRSIPMSPRMVEELRHWWRQHGHPTWLFPSPEPGRRATLSPNATHPMSAAGVQQAFHLALRVSRVNKPATVHTLRHSYATRLFEAGVGLRQIARYLGHHSIATTEIYTHLTEVSEAQVQIVLNRLYDQFDPAK